jgi:hypothetical protein
MAPQYSDNIELKHSYKNILISTLSYSNTTDVLSDVKRVDENTKLVYDTYTNLGTNKCVSLRIVLNKELFTWWNLNLTGSTFYAMYDGVISGKARTEKWSGYSLSLNTQFDLGKGWKTECYVNYISPGRWGLTINFDGHSYMDFGASKKINDRLLLKFSASDPFNIFSDNFHERSVGFRSDTKYRYASQLFSMSLTCNFGGHKPEARNTSTIDEIDRIK